MLVLALVLACLIGLEGLVVALFPKAVKRLLEAASPGLLRAAGLIELLLAAAAVALVLTLGRAV